MTSFVKLYGSILGSSVWSESLPTRIVWITMLALADERGKVEASVSGLARIANVTRAQCENALERLTAPDPDSKSPEFEGRRIEKVSGGWMILNYLAYRDLRSPRQVAEAERKARWRKGKSGTGTGQNGTETGQHVQSPEIQTEVEVEVEVETTTTKDHSLALLAKSSAEEHVVLAHYLATHPRRRIGPKDRKAVAKALTFGYSPLELCEAIDGNATDEWHREKRKHELPYVLRDTGKIDDFRARVETNGTEPPLVDEFGCLTAYGERVTRP